MVRRAIVFALMLTTTGVGLSSQSPWLRTDTQHFEIHYPPALTPALGRVVGSAERAYDRISGRLGFGLATRVPLVVFAPSGSVTRDQVIPAPSVPHRSRIAIPVPDGDAQLDALIVHELTHLLVGELLLPGTGGDRGLPRWVQEGIASYLAGTWSDEDERLMRELVGAGRLPALSQLAGAGGFANARSNDTLGHAAFDFIESRWGSAGIRRFLDALIVPRVNRTFDTVLDVTPAEFDEGFRQYAERRFRPAVR